MFSKYPTTSINSYFYKMTLIHQGQQQLTCTYNMYYSLRGSNRICPKEGCLSQMVNLSLPGTRKNQPPLENSSKSPLGIRLYQ